VGQAAPVTIRPNRAAGRRLVRSIGRSNHDSKPTCLPVVANHHAPWKLRWPLNDPNDRTGLTSSNATPQDAASDPRNSAPAASTHDTCTPSHGNAATAVPVAPIATTTAPVDDAATVVILVHISGTPRRMVQEPGTDGPDGSHTWDYRANGSDPKRFGSGTSGQDSSTFTGTCSMTGWTTLPTAWTSLRGSRADFLRTFCGLTLS